MGLTGLKIEARVSVILGHFLWMGDYFGSVIQ